MNGQRASTRSLTEGALLAALAVILVLAGTFMPVIGPLIVFLWPVPIVVVVLRHGLRTGVLTVITAGLVLSMVVGVIQGVLLAVTLGASGLVLGYGWLRQWNASRLLAAASAALVGVLVLSLAAARTLLTIDPIALSLEALRQGGEMSLALYERAGVPAGALETMSEMLAAMNELVPLLLPAGFVLGAVVNAYVNLTVASGVLRRLDYQAPELPPFARWQVPVWALFLYAAGIGLLWFSPEGPLFNVGFNIFYGLNLVIMVQGFAVAYFFLRRIRIPRFFSVLVLIVTAFDLGHIYVLVGLVEISFGLRQMVESRDGAGGSGASPERGKSR